MSIRLSKDISEIRAGLFERIEAVQDEYAARGWLPARLNLNKGIARGIIELFAWGLWQLYKFLEVVHRQAIPLEATGEWLDTHAAQVDEKRKPATKARGNVLFLRGDGTGNIRIPAGRIVRTLPDGKGDIYRYVTDELAVLPEGAASVAVPATAEEYGRGANAAVGQICDLATPVEGILGVTNTADWLLEEGADAENDASLQRRYVLAWQSKAGVTRAAYEAAALSVPGVVDVYVADQHPRGEGTVDVVVMGTAGMPTEKLLTDVRAALDAAIVINHDLLVRAPEPVNVTVRAVLELLSGDADAIRAEAESWVRSMFSYGDDPAIPRFSIGRDVVRDRLASGLVSIAGVKRIRWESPAGDVEIPTGGLAVLEALDLQTVWAEEE
ncbi:baseplate J/gp47 family protein [uncultured Desulfovibrio sp.]|uniref:baseplate J/gp47 family protein n=1 Tax=uncultured Desulfovibrio sp. TaxID=167968 RepID=UPI0027295B07|nr:baseplate J/gp47 family protein [uncultured Desulfovibrio sp.]